MLKKTLVGFVLGLGLLSNVGATELQQEMGAMAGSLSAAQMGFFTNSKAETLSSLLELSKHVKVTLGNEENIVNLLPEDLKHKSSIAINSARIIERNIAEIQKDLSDKNMRMINRQMRTQKAFLEIQNQCFRCHNLVRDWH